jgi:hypothetical protein
LTRAAVRAAVVDDQELQAAVGGQAWRTSSATNADSCRWERRPTPYELARERSAAEIKDVEAHDSAS